MLMTKLKSEEVISSLASGKVFIINCHGCKEVGFPEEEANALQKKLADAGKVVGTLTTDYVCNPTELALRLRGPMMGAPLKDTNVPIIKGSNGVIAIAADHTEEKECIKCGRCVDVCPMELQPLEIYKYGQLGDAEKLLTLNVMDCFSCKCCEYICSSKIPLVSKINAAKGLVMPLLKKK